MSQTRGNSISFGRRLAAWTELDDFERGSRLVADTVIKSTIFPQWKFNGAFDGKFGEYGLWWPLAVLFTWIDGRYQPRMS